MKKKLIGALLIALGALFAYSGFVSDAEYSTLGGIVFCIVLIFFGLRNLGIIKKNGKQSKANPAVSTPPSAPAPIHPVNIAPSPAKYRFVNFKVAGVTFDNDDGRNRQTIIADIQNQRPPFEDGENLNVYIRRTTFRGMLAFDVRVNDIQIGYVPKDMLDAVDEAMQHPDVQVSGFQITGGMKGYNYGVDIALKYKETE